MDITSYSSPFSFRYSNENMRAIWSESSKRILWHEAWLAAASLQFDIPIQGTQGAQHYNQEQFEDALKEEQITKHDLVAERKAFSKRMPKSVSKYLHVGLTSSDIEDYAEEQQIIKSIILLQTQANALCVSLAKFAEKTKRHIIIGRTHLQKAEPTLLGYRFVWYAEQILASGIFSLHFDRKGMHGAVGTNANLELIGSPTQSPMFKINEPVFQTYPRQKDLQVCAILSQAASVIHKMAFDIRVMAMEDILQEVKSKGQFGSSAMPGKNNPIQSEKLCGIARLFPGYYVSLWQCASNSLLERTLDDSSTRRIILPEMFLSMSEILETSNKLINSLYVSRSDQASLESVFQSWETWVPSRLLALIRSFGYDYDQVYNIVENPIGTGMSLSEYLDYVRSFFKEVSLEFSNRNVLLGLDKLEEVVEKIVVRWLNQ